MATGKILFQKWINKEYVLIHQDSILFTIKNKILINLLNDEIINLEEFNSNNNNKNYKMKIYNNNDTYNLQNDRNIQMTSIDNYKDFIYHSLHNHNMTINRENVRIEQNRIDIFVGSYNGFEIIFNLIQKEDIIYYKNWIYFLMNEILYGINPEYVSEFIIYEEKESYSEDLENLNLTQLDDSNNSNNPNNDTNNPLICNICLDKNKEILFNCNHLVCIQCSRRITSCPICRANITERRRIFI